MKRARVAYAGASTTPMPHARGLRLADGRIVAEDAVVWLAPFEVGTIIALGLNYADHAKELSFGKQEEPLVFLKGPGSVIGHRGSHAPAEGRHVHALRVRARGRHRRGGRAIAQGRRDAARRRLHGGQRLRDPRLPGELVPAQLRVSRTATAARCSGRGSSTRPTSPDPLQLSLRTLVNGKVTQQGNTRDLVHDIPSLIEYLSGFMTLQRRRRDPHRHARGRGQRRRRRRGGHRDRRHRPPGQHHRRRRDVRALKPTGEARACASST